MNAPPPTPFFKLKGELFFIENDSTGTSELWETDGTPDSTLLVTEIDSGGTNVTAGNMTEVGDEIFFKVNDDALTNQIWKSDGTASGTVYVTDIPNTASARYFLYNFMEVDGSLFFTVDKVDNGLAGVLAIQFWKSDGTVPGTAPFAEINTTGIGQVNNPINTLTRVGDSFYFGYHPPGGSAQLWRYNIATNSVTPVTSFAGTFGPVPQNLTNFNGVLFFTDNADQHLWKSDGTSSGTVLVTNAVGDFEHFTVVNDTMFFTSSEASIERLWKTDGTAAGTVRVSDSLSKVGNLTAVGDDLFFQADDGMHGTEPWVVPELTTAIGDFNNDGNVDVGDVTAAIQALTNPSASNSQYGLSAVDLAIVGDVNSDGSFNNLDLQSLLNMLTGGHASATDKVHDETNSAADQSSTSPVIVQASLSRTYRIELPAVFDLAQKSVAQWQLSHKLSAAQPSSLTHLPEIAASILSRQLNWEAYRSSSDLNGALGICSSDALLDSVRLTAAGGLPLWESASNDDTSGLSDSELAMSLAVDQVLTDFDEGEFAVKRS